MNMITIASLASAAILTTTASADIFRMTMSGTLTEVTDNRTAGDDDFAGTAWGLDNYFAEVGHSWTYTVFMDTSVSPAAFSNSESDYAYSIYDPAFDASLSINGIEMETSRQQLIHFESYETSLNAEIWGTVVDAPANAPTVFAFLSMVGSAPDIINGGNPFSDTSQLAGVVFNGFSIYGSDQDVFFIRDTNPDIMDITIERVPAPSTLLALTAASLFSTRRRR